MTQEDFKTKATVRISNHLFSSVRNKLHYGQLSLLFRAFFISLKRKIDEGKLMEIVQFMYGTKSITLSAKKKEKTNDSDGQN